MAINLFPFWKVIRNLFFLICWRLPETGKYSDEVGCLSNLLSGKSLQPVTVPTPACAKSLEEFEPRGIQLWHLPAMVWDDPPGLFWTQRFDYPGLKAHWWSPFRYLHNCLSLSWKLIQICRFYTYMHKMCAYIYIYTCIYICIYIYVYIDIYRYMCDPCAYIYVCIHTPFSWWFLFPRGKCPGLQDSFQRSAERA